MLLITNLTKRYNSEEVLNISSLVVERGITWIKGENGSGKSTLLKILAGWIPFEGTVNFKDGIGPYSHPVSYRRRVTFSEAEPAYPSFITPADLLSFTAHARGASVSDVKELVSWFAADHYLNKAISECSSGMVKKISLILSLLGSPSLVLLDEPFTTLDGAAVEKLQVIIKQKYNRESTSFLIASHEPENIVRTGYNAGLLIRNHTAEKF